MPWVEYECSVLIVLQMNIKENNDYRNLNAWMNRWLKKNRLSLAVYSTSAHTSFPNHWRVLISPQCIHHHPIRNEMVWICTAATAVRGFIDLTHWSAVITHSQIKNCLRAETGNWKPRSELSDTTCAVYICVVFFSSIQTKSIITLRQVWGRIQKLQTYSYWIVK